MDVLGSCDLGALVRLDEGVANPPPAFLFQDPESHSSQSLVQ